MSHQLMSLNGNTSDRLSALTAGEGVIFVGANGSDNYDQSSASGFTAGSKLFFYDTDPFLGITGASLNTSSGWTNEVTLPAGNYYIQAFFGATFSSSGGLTYKISIDNVAQLNQGSVGGTVGSNDGGPICSTYAELSSSAVITVTVSAATNVESVANQSTTPSKESWLMIRGIA